MSVYFAKVGRYLKIGYSQNPERRVRRLWSSTTRYGRPWDLSTTEPRELLLTIPGDMSTERQCHLALADFRAAGEFFIDEPAVRHFMVVAEGGHFPTVVRPHGPFEPVAGEHMIPEWRADMAAMLARARTSGLSLDTG